VQGWLSLSDVLLLGICCPFSQVVESVCRAVDTVLKADRVTGLRALANDKVVHLLSRTYQDAKRTADVEEAAAAGVVVRRRGPAHVCVVCSDLLFCVLDPTDSVYVCIQALGSLRIGGHVLDSVRCAIAACWVQVNSSAPYDPVKHAAAQKVASLVKATLKTVSSVAIGDMPSLAGEGGTPHPCPCPCPWHKSPFVCFVVGGHFPAPLQASE
jgi:hypothetical protein